MISLSTDKGIHSMRSDASVELTPAQLREYQLAILVIAKDVVGLCEELSVSYTLSGGTCLGAIRHGGFIPWDDDMDLNILRKDYARFIGAFRERYAGKYRVYVPGEARDHGLQITRIELVGTAARIPSNIGMPQTGVSLDLFVLENVPDNVLLRKLHETLCMGMGFALSCRRYAHLKNCLVPLLEQGSELERALRVKFRIGSLLSFASLDAWDRWTNRAYSLCRDDSSRFIAIPGGRKHYSGETYLRSAFFPTKKATFEGHDWSIPADADGYMRALYGPDYMTPLPPEKRERHLLLEFDLGEYGGASEQHGAAGEESA